MKQVAMVLRFRAEEFTPLAIGERLNIAIAVILCCQAAGLAQSPSVDPPLVGRPPDFSNIVGKYEIRASAAPTAVEVEQPVMLHVVISGEGPAKYEPKRTHLRIFPESWDRHFYIEEMRDDHRVDRAKKTWLFVYRLRPKHTRISAIDGIKLVYFDPNVPGKKKFLTQFVERIPIVVKPVPAKPSAIELVEALAPPSFYQVVPLDNVEPSVAASFSLSPVDAVSFLLVPPLACLLFAWMWRRYWPDEAERRRRKRSKAAQHATAKLRSAGEPVWDIISRYLQERFDFALEEPTPAETAALLLRRGFAKDVCRQCQALYRSCDALRFGRPSASEQQSLTEEALRLIVALEADPCAR